MVRENWASDVSLIKTVEIAFKCGLVDKTSAEVAILHVQSSMYDEFIAAGLSPGPGSPSIKEFTQRGVDAGYDTADSGTCASMTPAERGRLRALVASLGG
jgi:hypothetical protein